MATVRIDGDVVSWRLIELGKLPVAVTTSPSDERLLTKASEMAQDMLRIRAKFWGKPEERDQDNGLEAQSEHGLVGAQLGPNKNGKKW